MKIKIIRKYLVILSVIFISSCGHSNSFIIDSPNKDTKYNISSLEVKFREDLYTPNDIRINSNKDFSAYPNEKALTKIIKEILERKLKEQNIYSADAKNSETLKLKVNIDYQRLGIAWSKSAFHSALIKHKIDVMKNDVRVAQSVAGPYKVTRSYFSQAAVDQKTIFALRGPNDEVEDLEIAADVIAKELLQLAKNKR